MVGGMLLKTYYEYENPNLWPATLSGMSLANIHIALEDGDIKRANSLVESGLCYNILDIASKIDSPSDLSNDHYVESYISVLVYRAKKISDVCGDEGAIDKVAKFNKALNSQATPAGTPKSGAH